MTWHRHAKCRGMDTTIFFYGQIGRNRADEARTICAACPVRQDCLNEALATEPTGFRFGFLGGMTPDERDAEARRRNAPRVGRRLVAQCGTVSGYTRHRRRGEEACPECRAALAAHRRRTG